MPKKSSAPTTWASATKPKAKSKSSARKSSKVKQLPVPEHLMTAKVTPKMLADGKFQQKILSFYAQFNLPSLMSGLDALCKAGDPTGMRLTAEIYRLVSSKSGTNILVNQNNQQAIQNTNQKTEVNAPRSFEDIQRVLEEEALNRKAIPAAFEPSFEATPDSEIEYVTSGE